MVCIKIFCKTYLERHVPHKYVIQLIYKFTSTGSVYNKKQNRQEFENKEAIEVTVSGQVNLEDQQQTEKKVFHLPLLLKSYMYH